VTVGAGLRRRWVRVWASVCKDGVLRYRQLPSIKAAGGLDYSRAEGRPRTLDTPSKTGAARQTTRAGISGVVPLSRCVLDAELTEPLEHPLPIQEGGSKGVSPAKGAAGGDGDGDGGGGGGGGTSAAAEFHYRVLKKTAIRAGRAMTSDRVGSLEQGDTVAVRKLARNSEGQLRARCEKGWVSVASRDGVPLLARAGRAFLLTLRQQLPSSADGAEQQPPLLQIQAESPEEYMAWRSVLSEAAEVATAEARAALTSKVSVRHPVPWRLCWMPRLRCVLSGPADSFTDVLLRPPSQRCCQWCITAHSLTHPVTSGLTAAPCAARHGCRRSPSGAQPRGDMTPQSFWTSAGLGATRPKHPKRCEPDAVRAVRGAGKHARPGRAAVTPRWHVMTWQVHALCRASGERSHRRGGAHARRCDSPWSIVALSTDEGAATG
jgi:hypothetical protein